MDKKQLESFKWRVYNTSVSVILPAMGIVLLNALNNTPDSLDILVSKELWVSMAYAGLVAVLSGLLAGTHKVVRMRNEK